MKTHNIPFSIQKRKSPEIIPNLQLSNFFQGTQERVRNSCSKQAISVRAIEVLLYIGDVCTFRGSNCTIFCLPSLEEQILSCKNRKLLYL